MKKWDLLWKISIILVMIIALYIFIGLYYNNIGDQIFIFTIIPVAFTALFFGLWAGIVMETILLFLGFVLLSLITSNTIYVSFLDLTAKNIIGILSHYGLVALLGYMHDQHITIKRLNKEIIRISRIDDLTSLYNRRALLEAAQKEFIQTARNLSDVSLFLHMNNQDDSLPYNRENEINFKKNRALDDYLGVLTCALFDIDFFKRVNDTYGHLMGDEVLKKIGEILSAKGNLRESDIYGRYGGEEFLILFPGTSSRNSIYAIQRLTRMIKTEKFLTKDEKKFSITISAGVSQYRRGDKDINDIIHRADEALYYAKHHGRDRIIVFEKISS
jgi:diguanylate cyclase (GGDEF)-like protein